MTADVSVLVVGGGPAGVTAALQASELGARVTLLEAAQVGGTSLNSGPAPVRTLARAARLARDWSSWAQFGLTGAAPVPDLPAVLANSERVARYAHEKKDVAGHIRRHGVDLIEHLGPVSFTGPHTMAAGDGRTWTADRIILAVGGHAARLPIPGAELALTYEDIRSLKSLPGRVAVIGGADTGCQIASIFDDFGVAVTLFEAGPTLVPSADADVSAELGRAFRDRGMTVATDTFVTGLHRRGGSIYIDHRSGQALGQTAADAVFFAVGWPASMDGAEPGGGRGPAEPGVITVDEYLRTNVGHIFAVGDVNGQSMLVQTARQEGRIAARNAVLGPAGQAAYDVVPSGSFTDPEYGRVGLTEAQAAQRPRRRHRRRPLRRSAQARRRRPPGRLLQAHRRPADPRHPRRSRPRRVLGGNRPDRRRLHGGRPAGGAGGRAPARLPHLHRGGQHGRAEDLPGHRHRQLPPGLELPRHGRVTPARLRPGPAGPLWRVK